MEQQSQPLRHYRQCPACGDNRLLDGPLVKDHSVSGENFQLVQCAACGLRLTQDAPTLEGIGKYYDSPHYISHTDSRTGWLDRLYQAARTITLRRKEALLRQWSGQGRRLLDFGAGTGAFAHHMKRSGWDVTGLEPDAGARERSRSLYGLDLAVPEVLAGLPEGHFTAVTLWHVLEHVHELEDTVRRFRRVLHKDGALIVAVPNYLAADAKAYGSFWAAYDVPRHLYHFTPDSVRALASRTGFRVEQMKGMPLDAFYIALLSERYRTGGTRPVAAFMKGMRSNLHAFGKPGRSSSVIYLLRPV